MTFTFGAQGWLSEQGKQLVAWAAQKLFPSLGQLCPIAIVSYSQFLTSAHETSDIYIRTAHIGHCSVSKCLKHLVKKVNHALNKAVSQI